MSVGNGLFLENIEKVETVEKLENRVEKINKLEKLENRLRTYLVSIKQKNLDRFFAANIQANINTHIHSLFQTLCAIERRGDSLFPDLYILFESIWRQSFLSLLFVSSL